MTDRSEARGGRGGTSTHDLEGDQGNQWREVQAPDRWHESPEHAKARPVVDSRNPRTRPSPPIDGRTHDRTTAPRISSVYTDTKLLMMLTTR